MGSMTIWGMTLVFLGMWSYGQGRSQHKFFKKKNSKDQDFELPSFTTVFLIHFFTNLVVTVIYHLYNMSANKELESGVMVNPIETSLNMYLFIGLGMIIWIIASLLGRFFLSKIILKIEQGTIINSLKFIIAEHVLLYGGFGAYFLFLYFMARKTLGM
jgi:hypothetical protein